MTNEETIKMLRTIKRTVCLGNRKFHDALDVAIKALEAHGGDTISRQAAIDLVRDVCDAIMSGCESWYDPETEDEVYKDIREVDAILKCNKEIRIALRNMPSAQPELIRCKDCKYYSHPWHCEAWNNSPGFPAVSDEMFCSMAERRTDESNVQDK